MTTPESLEQQFTQYVEKAPGRLGLYIVALVDTAKALQLGAQTNGMFLTDYEAYLLAVQLLGVAEQ